MESRSWAGSPSNPPVHKTSSSSQWANAVWNLVQRRRGHPRESNEIRILQIVREKGRISRIELAKATNLHKATVTELVAKLIRAGYLKDTGEVVVRNKVGRKRVLLKFLPRAGLVAGIDIRMTHATVALCDLNAHVLLEESFDYSVEESVKQVFKRAAASIRSLLKAAGLPEAKLLGIGIGVQGVIDYSTNTLVLSYNKKSWQGESLSEYLEGEFSVPVFVENDVKTMALGEYLFGVAKGTKDFVHIWVGEGIGAGIMINGQLLHGVTSSAGEIGYNLVEFPAQYREKFPLIYGDQEMVGQFLTDANLLASYKRANGGAPGDANSVASVAERARLGDTAAQQIIDEFTSLLSTLCIAMLNTLNPGVIILGGCLAEAFPGIAEMVQLKIHRDLLTPPAEAVKVRTASLGDSAVILGAAGLVLYELFEPLQRVSVRSSRHANGEFLNAFSAD
jgi:predicted NBD/HSP70 family sugar kinase